jgi:hypothetical protein
LALSAACSFAVSNIAPAYSRVESDFIGTIDWRPGSAFGAQINPYYCSGFLYGPQVGWINLGNGAPADALRYRNDSAGDFGVNVLPSGALRGFAYGANIGWISFEDRGNPRVNWANGELSGAIYSANTGWIPLEGLDGHLRVESMGQLDDRDADGLPDAWEIRYAGNVQEMSIRSDSDGDGQSDRDEFLSGTDPFDPSQYLGRLILSRDARSISWPTQAGFVYHVESSRFVGPGANWKKISVAPITGTGLTVSVGLPLDSGAFFRVRSFPPLSGN